MARGHADGRCGANRHLPNGDARRERIEGHSLDPSGDPDLWWFGALGYDALGELAEIPFLAEDIDDRLVRPHATVNRSFVFPALAPGDYTLVVKLQFRSLQPYFLRTLETHPLTELDPALGLPSRVPVMTMADATLPFAVQP